MTLICKRDFEVKRVNRQPTGQLVNGCHPSYVDKGSKRREENTVPGPQWCHSDKGYSRLMARTHSLILGS